MTRVLIAGVSTRAAAGSAARAGFEVTAIDGYGDRDQHAGVRAVSLKRDFGIQFSTSAAAAAGAASPADAVAYLSSFENDPDAVTALAAGRAVWGNPPEVLRRARNPFAVADAFQSNGLSVPELAHDSNARHGRFLLKPLTSGGGHGVRAWAAGRRVPRGWYLQEQIAGTPGSIVFVGAAGRVVPLGVSRQIVGDPRFGASGFRYCGTILAPDEDPQFTRTDALMPAARHLAIAGASAFGLVGVNGIDFIAQDGVPYPIEINPRWTAAVEIAERATGVSAFALHAAAFGESGHHEPGHLTVRLDPPRPVSHAFGKAIVFARNAGLIGDTNRWLLDPDVGDVPHPGESIAPGSPVCTVFAEAATAAACEAELVRRAARIYADLDAWTPVSPITIHHSPFTIRE